MDGYIGHRCGNDDVDWAALIVEVENEAGATNTMKVLVFCFSTPPTTPESSHHANTSTL
jgi:hypothetical protein